MAEIDQCTPPDVRDVAAAARDNNLPDKSRADYEKAYEKFLAWQQMKKVPDGYVSENVLLAYFTDLSECYAPSTLWSISSKLKALILLKHAIDIGQYEALTQFLKKKSRNFEAKKSAVFTRAEVDAFLRAPDEPHLVQKLIFAFGVFGGMRKSEIAALAPADIKDTGTQLEVMIRNGKTGDRWFIVTPAADSAVDVVALYRRYAALRPKGPVPAGRFFLRYFKGRCTAQPIGKNKIGEIPGMIATFLKLAEPRKYTGHAMRRTGATLLADEGVDLLTLKRFGAWKSDSVAQGYVANSKDVKRKLSETVQGSKAREFKFQALQASAPQPTFALGTAPVLNINGGTNVINVYMAAPASVPHADAVPVRQPDV